ncbi:MAG: DUF2207 domain-containing protein [Candidatus Micrarchaeota archaeon]
MRKALAILAFVVLLGLLFAQDEEDNFELLKNAVDIQINPDGSFNVTENMTLLLHGRFYYFYRDLPLKSPDGRTIRITNTSIYENNEAIEVGFSRVGDSGRVLWWFNAEDEERTFVLRYVVRNSIVRYTDVADFSWMVHGADWGADANEVSAIVRLPGGLSDDGVFAWAHGAVSGEMDVRTGVLVLNAKNVPAQTPIEIRVMFPYYAIIGDSAHVAEGGGFRKIMDGERTRIDGERLIALASGMLPFMPLGFPVLLLVAFAILWSVYGREHAVEFEQEYFHEPPYNYQPSILGVLMDSVRKKPGRNAYIATILNLAQRGYIKLEEIGAESERDIRLTLVKQPDDKIELHEALALACLFGKRDVFLAASERPGAFKRIALAFQDSEQKADTPELSIKEIRLGELRQNRGLKTYFDAYYERWQGEAALAGKKFGFHEERASLIAKEFSIGVGFLLVVLFPVALLFFTMVRMGEGALLALLVNIFASILLGFFLTVKGNKALQKRTPKGALHYKKWMAFSKFVSDMTLLKQHPPGSIAIWNQYLVYATALGCAENVSGSVKLDVKPSEDDNDYAWFDFHAKNKDWDAEEAGYRALKTFVPDFDSLIESWTGPIELPGEGRSSKEKKN